MLACDAIDSYDLGDAVAFLVAVREQRAPDERAPLTWQQARVTLGDDFMQRWAEKSARERDAARASMRWKP
jgi:hypothetical protein